MRTIAIQIPDEIADVLAADESQLQQELQMVVAVKLYELGRLSAGAAAALVGLSRLEFLNRLSAYRVSPINLDEESIEREIATAHEIADCK